MRRPLPGHIRPGAAGLRARTRSAQFATAVACAAVGLVAGAAVLSVGACAGAPAARVPSTTAGIDRAAGYDPVPALWAVTEPASATAHLPYVTREGRMPLGDPVIRRVARRTMAMTGRIDTWDWEGGIAMVGLMRAYEVTRDGAILAHVAAWTDARLAEGTPITGSGWSDPPCGTADWPGGTYRHPNHAAPAWAVLLLYEHRPRPEYQAVVAATVEYLLRGACRSAGTLAHRPDELWDDTLAMTVPLLARYGARFDRPDILDQAVEEYLVHTRYLQDPSSGLWFHGWSFRTADHMSGAHWARGNGWVAVTAAELLSAMPSDHPRRAAVERARDAQLEGLAAAQAPGGLWHTVVDRADFYLETSGSAAIAAGLLQSPDPDLRSRGRTARSAVYRKVAGDGTVTDVSTGTGVAPTVDTYNQVPHDQIKPYGQGLFLIMATAGP
jgi:unsaturated rhamnogalacturonyl hydrolase